MSLFKPIMAGATLRDRAVACVGALVGIGLTGLIARLVLGGAAPLPLTLAAPMGASAVLLFAVPASPLAQPWSIVGGNVISGLVGVSIAHLGLNPLLACPLAVLSAIAAMSLCRCLHPPGGAVALSAVLAAPFSTSLAGALGGYGWVLAPVGLDSVLLVSAGWLFHRVSGHTYPHRPKPAPPLPALGFTEDDIDRALRDVGEPLDISRSDLEALFRLIEANAQRRLAARAQ